MVMCVAELVELAVKHLISGRATNFFFCLILNASEEANIPSLSIPLRPSKSNQLGQPILQLYTIMKFQGTFQM